MRLAALTGAALALAMVLGSVGLPRYYGTECNGAPVPLQLGRNASDLSHCATVARITE